MYLYTSISYCSISIIKYHNQIIYKREPWNVGDHGSRGLCPWLSCQGSWSQAGSHNAEAVTESLHLSCKHKEERKLSMNDVGFWNLKTTPGTPHPRRPYLIILPKHFHHEDQAFKYMQLCGHLHSNHHNSCTCMWQGQPSLLIKKLSKIFQKVKILRIVPKIITLYKYVQTNIFFSVRGLAEYGIFTKYLPGLGYYKYLREA